MYVYLEFGDGKPHGKSGNVSWKRWQVAPMKRGDAESRADTLRQRYPEWQFRLVECPQKLNA